MSQTSKTNPQAFNLETLGTRVLVHNGLVSIVHTAKFDGTPIAKPKALKGDRTMYSIAEVGNGYTGDEVAVEGMDLNAKAPQGREVIAKLKIGLAFFAQPLTKPVDSISFM